MTRSRLGDLNCSSTLMFPSFQIGRQQEYYYTLLTVTTAITIVRRTYCNAIEYRITHKKGTSIHCPDRLNLTGQINSSFAAVAL